MRLVGSASWQVRSDLPEALQFSGSVGEHAGFRLAPDQAPHQAPRDSTEAAWRLWWHQLLTHTFGLLMEQVAEEMPASSPAEHQARLREGAERARREYGPPTFPELAHSSDLQRLCRQEWPPFLAGWGSIGGQKQLLVSQMHAQFQRVRLDRIVRACAVEAGKSAPAPFVLRVDYVRWPHDYRHRVSHQHLVLGAHYLEAAHADELQAALQSAILPLI
jgi:hypothetical protein